MSEGKILSSYKVPELTEDLPASRKLLLFVQHMHVPSKSYRFQEVHKEALL